MKSLDKSMKLKKPRKQKTHPAGWWRSRALEKAQRLAKFRESWGGPTPEQRFCRCISCGRTVHLAGASDRAEGGHYVSRNCHATEMDPDNIHPQCHVCNCHLSGNVIAYRISLVQRIGEDRVRRLEDMFAASKGDEEALARLSDRDQLEVMRKKGVAYYKQRCTELDEELARVQKDW